jgi:hypothetical protein
MGAGAIGAGAMGAGAGIAGGTGVGAGVDIGGGNPGAGAGGGGADTGIDLGSGGGGPTTSGGFTFRLPCGSRLIAWFGFCDRSGMMMIGVPGGNCETSSGAPDGLGVDAESATTIGAAACGGGFTGGAGQAGLSCAIAPR